MEKTSDKKDVILQKSICLFATKGYDGVGVQEICSAAKITKPTLYYYFNNKAGLLQAIVATKGHDFLNCIALAAQFSGDFIFSLNTIINSCAHFAQENPDFFRLHCTLQTASPNSEAAQQYLPLSQTIDEVYLNFFKKSSEQIGNMRSKEIIFSRMFRQIVDSACLDLLSESTRKKNIHLQAIVHAFAYGVVSG